ncbi:retrovirus-related pol polyprotein from transposon TNT 1-94 [Tanacetum coccineum]
MGLYGPMRIQSNNGQKYILVIVDDYSRFTCVKFLQSKDEVLEFVIKFLKMIQDRLNTTVRNIKINNGTEFVIQTLRAYYEDVGISHQTSVARTPQQNDVLTTMASKQFSSGPGPQLLTPGTLSSGPVLNPPSPTPYVPPTKKDLDILFQPMFDEYFNPPPSVAYPVPTIVAPKPVDSTGPPSSTTIDQDAPSINNNPFFGVLIPEVKFEESSLRDVIPTNVHSINQPPEHLSKWMKDHPLNNNYKEALKEACWIEAMQEELNEFDRLKVWKLVPRPYRVMIITLKWIFKVKLDELGGVLKNKARLVARGYRQEKGIDFEESFVPIA